MATVREAWTDERLDDLNGRVDRGFGEMREEFRAVRSEFTAVRSEMTAMSRTFIQAGTAALATMMVGFGATIATVLLST